MDHSELRSFLVAAKSYPLLTREEEQYLSREYHAGLQAANDLAEGNLSDEQIAERNRLAQAGTNARIRFINSNLRLVLRVAQQHHKSDVLTLSDLVQEGTIGLMRAIDKFDPDRGFKFSTYATWWIRQAISLAIRQASLIRIPLYKQDAHNKVRAALSMAERRNEGPLDDQMIAERMGMSACDVAAAREIPQVGASIEDPLGQDSHKIGDELYDESAEDAELACILSDVRAKFEQLFDGFTDRERLIFQLRFGEDSVPIVEIGQAVNISRERVRQIIDKRSVQLRERAIALGLV